MAYEPTGKRRGPPTLEERWEKEVASAERDAMRAMMGIVAKDLHKTKCPNCKHEFEAMVFKASPSNLIAAAKFLLEHSQGKAPVRTPIDPNKRDAKQITSVVSHDIEDTE